MIFFDFDGTIVDVWDRYYQAFRVLSGALELKREDYIIMKKTYRNDAIIAEKVGIALPDDYKEKKGYLLESIEFLRLDGLIVPDYMIKDYFSDNECRILTNRKRKNIFFAQLDWLGISELKDRAIVLDGSRYKDKKQFLRLEFSGQKNILIGDSEAEWSCFDIDNMKVYIVRSGLRIPESFDKIKQCTVIEDISYFIQKRS